MNLQEPGRSASQGLSDLACGLPAPRQLQEQTVHVGVTANFVMKVHLLGHFRVGM